MQAIVILLIAAVVFLICWGVDQLFVRLFRSKAQHRSGLAVRSSKRYGLFGVIFTVLGILGIFSGTGGDKILLYAGIVVMLMGIALAVHYLSFGIFYDAESFLISRFGRKDREHRYDEIVSQKLYVITGGSIVVELHMADGKAVSVQSTMNGAYPFLDAAFAGWCRLKAIDPQACEFHDPANHLWFPSED